MVTSNVSAQESWNGKVMLTRRISERMTMGMRVSVSSSASVYRGMGRTMTTRNNARNRCPQAEMRRQCDEGLKMNVAAS